MAISFSHTNIQFNPTIVRMLIEDELQFFFILNILIPTFGIPNIEIISWNGFGIADVMIKDIE